MSSTASRTVPLGVASAAMGNEFGFLHLCDADESFQSTLSTPFYSVRKIKNEAIHFRDINIIKNTVKEHTLLLM